MYRALVRLGKAVAGKPLGRWFQRHQSENYLRFDIPYEEKLARHPEVFLEGDAVRRGALFLAIRTLKAECIEGSFAEVGVYKGTTSRLIHRQDPERRMLLFDTFEGFDHRDLAAESNADANGDRRFKDTSVEGVLKFMEANDQVEVRQGWFPETTAGLESERYALVSLDADKYGPTKAGLDYFFPRLVAGGYLFLHDYNSPESNRDVARAVREFMADKAESPVEIPDLNGSLVIRKNRNVAG